MNAIMMFLTQTPWYVYAIFIYVIWIGVKSVRGRTVSIKKLFIIPILFIILSIDTMITSVHLTGGLVFAWLIGLVLGAGFGWWQFAPLVMAIDQKQKLLKLKGSWVPAILIFITFVIKYYIGYSLAMDSNISSDTLIILMLLSGFFTGAFVGRLLQGLYQLKVGSHQDLKAA